MFPFPSFNDCVEYCNFSESQLTSAFDKIFEKSTNYFRDHNEFIKSKEVKNWYADPYCEHFYDSFFSFIGLFLSRLFWRVLRRWRLT
jgi:hypothetical protein